MREAKVISYSSASSIAARRLHRARVKAAEGIKGDEQLCPCVICFEGVRSMRFRPCGHAPCCTDCLLRLTTIDDDAYKLTCPLCKADVSQIEWPDAPRPQRATAPATCTVVHPPRSSPFLCGAGKEYPKRAAGYDGCGDDHDGECGEWCDDAHSGGGRGGRVGGVSGASSPSPPPSPVATGSSSAPSPSASSHAGSVAGAHPPFAPPPLPSAVLHAPPSPLLFTPLAACPSPVIPQLRTYEKRPACAPLGLGAAIDALAADTRAPPAQLRARRLRRRWIRHQAPNLRRALTHGRQEEARALLALGVSANAPVDGGRYGAADGESSEDDEAGGETRRQRRRRRRRGRR